MLLLLLLLLLLLDEYTNDILTSIDSMSGCRSFFVDRKLRNEWDDGGNSFKFNKISLAGELYLERPYLWYSPSSFFCRNNIQFSSRNFIEPTRWVMWWRTYVSKIRQNISLYDISVQARIFECRRSSDLSLSVGLLNYIYRPTWNLLPYDT